MEHVWVPFSLSQMGHSLLMLLTELFLQLHLIPAPSMVPTPYPTTGNLLVAKQFYTSAHNTWKFMKSLAIFWRQVHHVIIHTFCAARVSQGNWVKQTFINFSKNFFWQKYNKTDPLGLYFRLWILKEFFNWEKKLKLHQASHRMTIGNKYWYSVKFI